MATESDDEPLDLSTKTKLLDGDISKQLKRYLPIYEYKRTELYEYNIDRNQLVYNMHLDFLNSGSNLIRTNTYHALYPYINSNLQLNEDNYNELVGKAVHSAKESVEEYYIKNSKSKSRISIVGSCSCFNHESLNFLQSDELKSAHRQRIRTLLQCGVDMLSLENIRNIGEAEMLFDIMREFLNTNIKFLVMFDGTENLFNLMLVDWIRDFYNMYGSQIIAIGWNNINNVTAGKFCEQIKKESKAENLIPLVICTNRDGESWNPINVKNHAPVREWHKFGIRYIGGGKDVVPQDIKSLRKKLNNT